ncbi:MAG: hypothetical protein GY951_16465, partial [Psychromonas sp.]|nr:hypothetical protein [Psychromonas sp.]
SGLFAQAFTAAKVSNVWVNRETVFDASSLGGATDTTTAFLTDSTSMAGIFESNSTWRLVNNGTYPTLQGLMSTPTAKKDVASSITDINDLTAYLANDIDHDGNVPTVAEFITSKINSTDDSLNVFYVPGTILPHGDTLWGAPSHIAVPVTVPIEIATYEDLKKIGTRYSHPLDAKYVVTADINAEASLGEGGFVGLIVLVLLTSFFVKK